MKGPERLPITPLERVHLPLHKRRGRGRAAFENRKQSKSYHRIGNQFLFAEKKKTPALYEMSARRLKAYSKYLSCAEEAMLQQRGEERGKNGRQAKPIQSSTKRAAPSFFYLKGKSANHATKRKRFPSYL